MKVSTTAQWAFFLALVFSGSHTYANSDFKVTYAVDFKERVKMFCYQVFQARFAQLSYQPKHFRWENSDVPEHRLFAATGAYAPKSFNPDSVNSLIYLPDAEETIEAARDFGVFTETSYLQFIRNSSSDIEAYRNISILVAPSSEEDVEFMRQVMAKPVFHSHLQIRVGESGAYNQSKLSNVLVGVSAHQMVYPVDLSAIDIRGLFEPVVQIIIAHPIADLIVRRKGALSRELRLSLPTDRELQLLRRYSRAMPDVLFDLSTVGANGLTYTVMAQNGEFIEFENVSEN